MPNVSSQQTIGVVGAGITGLTTAFKLAQAGHEVVVIEADGRAGGQIATTRTDDGYLVERGPHTLLNRDGLPRLIGELDLDDRVVHANDQAHKRFVVRAGRPHALPTGAMSFLRTPILSASAKLRMLAEPFIPRNTSAGESLADFVTRRLGPEALEFGVGPMVAGTFAGDPAKLSVKHAFPKLYDLERDHGSVVGGMAASAIQHAAGAPTGRHKRPGLISFDQGSQVLTDTLVAQLEANIELNSRVFELRKKDNDRWLIRFRQQKKRRQKTVDSVVCTAPAHALCDIELDADGGPTFAKLGDVNYAPVAIVALGFRRRDIRHRLDGFGMLIPSQEHRGILGTLFMSSLFDGRAPEDRVLLTNFVGGARSPGLAGRDPDRLLGDVVSDLDDLLGVDAEPVFHQHIAWPQAIPQYEVGYGRFLDHIDALEHSHTGLFMGGSFRDAIAVPDLISAGYSLAERIHNIH